MRISAQESAPSRRAAHGHRHGATRGGGFGSRDFEEVVLHAPWIDFSDPGCFGRLRLWTFTWLAAKHLTVSGRLLSVGDRRLDPAPWARGRAPGSSVGSQFAPVTGATTRKSLELYQEPPETTRNHRQALESQRTGFNGLQRTRKHLQHYLTHIYIVTEHITCIWANILGWNLWGKTFGENSCRKTIPVSVPKNDPRFVWPTMIPILFIQKWSSFVWSKMIPISLDEIVPNFVWPKMIPNLFDQRWSPPLFDQKRSPLCLTKWYHFVWPKLIPNLPDQQWSKFCLSDNDHNFA